MLLMSALPPHVAFLCHLFGFQRKAPHKRGPPLLQNRQQKKGNASSSLLAEGKSEPKKKEEQEDGKPVVR